MERLLSHQLERRDYASLLPKTISSLLKFNIGITGENFTGIKKGEWEAPNSDRPTNQGESTG